MSTCTAAELKNEGNQLFTARKYREAIACYSKAIIRDPCVSTYYSNRALCHLKLKQWDMACQDSQRAIDNNQNSVKGHFFLGQALFELNLFDEAIASLSRAFDLTKDQRQSFGEDITTLIRVAKKKKWALEEDKRIKQEIELQSHINTLLLAEKNKNTEDLKRLSNHEDKDIAVEIEKLEKNYEDRLNQVNSIFTQVDERRQKREVPDVMCSRISFGIMRDPVITPSGITYERKDIVEHLQRLGHFDPVTRKELCQEQLVPNLALKELIDNFLIENPWAEDY